MALLAPRGTVPMIRLQGRSLDVMAAGTLASKLVRSINAGSRNCGCGLRWPHRQRCGHCHARYLGENRVPFNGTESARLEQTQQSSASKTQGRDYNQGAFLLKHVRTSLRYSGRTDFERITYNDRAN
jgi:hypothetical protein